MKKTYMKPHTEAMEIKLHGMIATSPGDPLYGGSGSGSADAPERQEMEDLRDFSDITLW